MKFTFPHTITNPTGEILTFSRLLKEPGGDKLVGENAVMPKCGPPMHVHYLQDEGFTVLKGKIGYQVKGGPEQFACEGDSVVFKRGVPHRFWNAGDDVLQCTGWVQPANTFMYYISAVFEAQNKTGTERPAIFDAAYLLTRYQAEYDMLAIPFFVRKVIFPIIYVTGSILGKYKHFKDAPAPVKQ